MPSLFIYFFYFQLTRNILASEVRVTRFTINWHDTKEHEEQEEEKMEEDGACGIEKPVPSTSKLPEEIERRIAQDLAYERADRDRLKIPFSDSGNLYPHDDMRYCSEDSSSLCMP